MSSRYEPSVAESSIVPLHSTCNVPLHRHYIVHATSSSIVPPTQYAPTRALTCPNLRKLPWLTSVSPMWWMANQVNAAAVTLTVRGAYLSPWARAQGRAEARVSRHGFLTSPPLPGTYVMVDGQACEESELISDSEVRCHGFPPFPRSGEVRVRVLEPPSANQVINSEKCTL